MRNGRIAVVALIAALACACSKGKQEAAVALDEARLSVGQARKAGGENFAPKLM
ncbi:MAG: hypothetical protein HY611_06210, partial [Elusimicrobia bacterium]|nr:hypothetical protein [Elusimicrobiota bacterium]